MHAPFTTLGRSSIALDCTRLHFVPLAAGDSELIRELRLCCLRAAEGDKISGGRGGGGGGPRVCQASVQGPSPLSRIKRSPQLSPVLLASSFFRNHLLARYHCTALHSTA